MRNNQTPKFIRLKNLLVEVVFMLIKTISSNQHQNVYKIPIKFDCVDNTTGDFQTKRLSLYIQGSDNTLMMGYSNSFKSDDIISLTPQKNDWVSTVDNLIENCCLDCQKDFESPEHDVQLMYHLSEVIKDTRIRYTLDESTDQVVCLLEPIKTD